MKTSVLLFGALIAFSQSFAQIKTPPSSPTATITQEFGLGQIGITYSRPSTKGRTIFGDIVPYDQVWHTGSTSSAKFSTTEELKLEGNTLAPGKYALYTIPGKLDWTIIINRDTSELGKEYRQDMDVLRFMVKPILLPYKIESFNIGLTNLSMSSATMELAWENVLIPIRLESDVDAKIMSMIQATLNPGPIANNYYTAANYYFESGRDLNQALEWASAASIMRPDAFWMSHLKAKIQARNQDYPGAIESATKSMEMAQQKSNADYVKMNEKLIAECKAKSAAPVANTTAGKGNTLGKPGTKPAPVANKPAAGTKPASPVKK